jgi:hypothetical protein
MAITGVGTTVAIGAGGTGTGAGAVITGAIVTGVGATVTGVGATVTGVTAIGETSEAEEDTVSRIASYG